ncbi:uncharacterized protein MYU51_013899 [Penicillium brevicompactum]
MSATPNGPTASTAVTAVICAALIIGLCFAAFTRWFCYIRRRSTEGNPAAVPPSVFQLQANQSKVQEKPLTVEDLNKYLPMIEYKMWKSQQYEQRMSFPQTATEAQKTLSDPNVSALLPQSPTEDPVHLSNLNASVGAQGQVNLSEEVRNPWIITLSVLSLVIIYPYGNLKAVDAYFFGASASAESGLNTISLWAFLQLLISAKWSEEIKDCELVFRARATTFVCLTWFALFLAWEMVNLRRSFFRMQPKSKKYFTQWMYDVWRNKFLFWSIMAGWITMFPMIYIPVLNDVVFKHKPITWEWGIVAVEAVLFFIGVEAWKWTKRVFFRRRVRKSSMLSSSRDVPEHP